jgi:hypothetical protein
MHVVSIKHLWRLEAPGGAWRRPEAPGGFWETIGGGPARRRPEAPGRARRRPEDFGGQMTLVTITSPSTVFSLLGHYEDGPCKYAFALPSHLGLRSDIYIPTLLHSKGLSQPGLHFNLSTLLQDDPQAATQGSSQGWGDGISNLTVTGVNVTSKLEVVRETLHCIP